MRVNMTGEGDPHLRNIQRAMQTVGGFDTCITKCSITHKPVDKNIEKLDRDQGFSATGTLCRIVPTA